ncbi:unnamed protein product [Polarella glacialis]|nr:unnamed protein product [Polarella glacialis]
MASSHAQALMFALRMLEHQQGHECIQQTGNKEQKVGIAHDRDALWLVGAREEAEGVQTLAGGLEALSLLKKQSCQPTRIVLIGPELARTERNYYCSAGLHVSTVDCTLEETLSEQPASHECRSWLPLPCCAFLLNSGLGTRMLPVAGPWLPALPLLLELQVPVCLVAPSRIESAGEREILVGLLGARALTRIVHCPCPAYGGASAVAGCSNAYCWWCLGVASQVRGGLPEVRKHVEERTRTAARLQASSWLVAAQDAWPQQ